jgi:hypothetical protein
MLDCRGTCGQLQSFRGIAKFGQAEYRCGSMQSMGKRLKVGVRGCTFYLSRSERGGKACQVRLLTVQTNKKGLAHIFV